MSPESHRGLSKPAVFTIGCRLCLRYRSTQETRNDQNKSAIGYVIADEDDVLVIEEYRNFVRENDHRHIIFDTTTKDVYSQTQKQTQRIGQASEVVLWAPPWETKWDTTAAGLSILPHIEPGYQMIEEDIYKFLDPDRLEGSDGWSPDDMCDNPIPEKIRKRNPETAYHPPVDLDF